MAFKIKPKDIDISRLDHIHQLIIDIESNQNVQRKKDAFIAFESMEGKQYDHVIDRLKNLYPESYQNFRIGDVNIVNKVVRKKNKAYKNMPMRKLDTDAETIELGRIYDEFKFGRAFKEADKIFNLHKYVCLWLKYINPEEGSEALEGKYYLQALAPYEYDIVVDKMNRPLIFCHNYASTDVTKGADGIEQVTKESQRDTSAETKHYKFISKDYITEVTTRGMLNNGNPNIDKIDVKPNPIKHIPIAFLSQDTAYDYPVTSALAKKSIDWNTEFSDLKTAAATQGHGQLTISHPERMKLKKLHMGMFTAINLPQSSKDADKETKADYISANPDLMGQLSVLKFGLLNILDDEGITSNSAIEGGVDEVKSGFDRILKEADVQDIIEDNQSLYAEILEQDVFKSLKAMKEGLNDGIFRSDKVDVTFDKPKVLINDSETLDNIKKREDLGLLLSHEKHMIVDPNLGEEAAKEREELIAEERVERMAAMQSIMGDEEDEEGVEE